jgi:DNA-binding response OmpR family regulator
VSESSITVVSKRRVIVVDDEKVLATSLALILNQAGFETHAMFSGEEAVDSLGRIQPDLLITDVILPGYDRDRNRNHHSQQTSRM